MWNMTRAYGMLLPCNEPQHVQVCRVRLKTATQLRRSMAPLRETKDDDDDNHLQASLESPSLT